MELNTIVRYYYQISFSLNSLFSRNFIPIPPKAYGISRFTHTSTTQSSAVFSRFHGTSLEEKLADEIIGETLSLHCLQLRGRTTARSLTTPQSSAVFSQKHGTTLDQIIPNICSNTLIDSDSKQPMSLNSSSSSIPEEFSFAESRLHRRTLHRQFISSLTSNIQFRHECLLQTDVSDATLIYFSSLMFEEEFIARVIEKVLREAPKLRVFMMLNKMTSTTESVDKRESSGTTKLRKLVFHHLLHVEMSWQKAASDSLKNACVYVYRVEEG